jgi:hypothetical protein
VVPPPPDSEVSLDVVAVGSLQVVLVGVEEVVVVVGRPQPPSIEGTASGPEPMGTMFVPQSSLLAM